MKNCLIAVFFCIAAGLFAVSERSFDMSKIDNLSITCDTG